MIAVIDYGAGNVTSVVNAFRRLGQECIVTSNPAVLKECRGVVMPGQGRAKSALEHLSGSGALQAVRSLDRPFLGICLGMQILAEHLAEDCVPGLGILPGEVLRLPALRVPHIGWNRVLRRLSDPLLEGIGQAEYFYFAHSYYLEAPDCNNLAHTWYGIPFPAVARQANFWAVQFHPEKSGPVGMRLLSNFLALCK